MHEVVIHGKGAELTKDCRGAWGSSGAPDPDPERVLFRDIYKYVVSRDSSYPESGIYLNFLC